MRLPDSIIAPDRDKIESLCSKHRNSNEDETKHGKILDKILTTGRARRDRLHAISIACASAGRCLSNIRKPPCLCLYGHVLKLWRVGPAVREAWRMAAKQRAGKRRASCLDDADRAAISGGDLCCSARRLYGCECQSTVYAAITCI